MTHAAENKGHEGVFSLALFGILAFALLWRVLALLRGLNPSKVRMAFNVWRLVSFEVETENPDRSPPMETKAPATQRKSTSSSRKTQRPATR
ncbi:hypothetical protein SAMN05660657_05541 [Geodermatophilus amargosae]|uniref:Uncharacterized protein n=1 Tax=Geodermatophilus amargosae TaxID=1296565 RepID=A0A1I7DA48_9ACTN|nr:hypothetical protein [Geodermatophilus amargosae]SFU08593.1 hypothetical protein SAMN05660657_05541 [Geodermatophilus amargosae]